VVVTGAPVFDQWFGQAPGTTREEFCWKVGLPADRPYFLYLCSSTFIAREEAAFVRQWIEAIRTSPDRRVRDAGVLVRPHPRGVEAQWAAFDAAGLQDTAVWPRGDTNPVDAETKQDYFDSLYHAAAAVGINTTAQIEAAIVGRPVYSLRVPEYAPTQEGTLHFHYLLNEGGGLLRMADSLDEHVGMLSTALEHGNAESARLREFVRAFVRPSGIETPATPQLADAIEALGATTQAIRARREAAAEGPAPWTEEDQARREKSMRNALTSIREPGDIIAGPWTGEVGFELLYWIPCLTWMAREGQLDGRRLVVVSRGGAAPWYRHLTSRYVDILDLVSPDEFLRRTSEEKKRKQYSPKRPFDRELIAQVRERLALPDAALIHPSAMFRLFTGLWRGRTTVDLVEPFTAFRPLAPVDDAVAAAARRGLPDDYVVAKFYFSRSFDDCPENRAFVSDLLRRVSSQVPVALLSTTTRLDDHEDFRVSGGSGVYVVDALQVPQKNLEHQTALISGARGFLGTYGGFSYLAPFYGVRSMSFFSRRAGFEQHHLDLATRVFDTVMPGGFAALDTHVVGPADPAVARWVATPRASRQEAGVL
jgi:hypothetical protein